MIKIEHTLFALPFTLSAAFLALNYIGALPKINLLDLLNEISLFNQENNSTETKIPNLDESTNFISHSLDWSTLIHAAPNEDFSPIVFVWIILCMLGARSAGMTLNRIIDAKIDAANPRTAQREIPRGKISIAQAWIFTLISFVILIYSAFQLPKLCQYLLPIPIIWVWVYPYLKRFTWFCHFFLGITLGGAALGGWIAITGTIDTIAPLYFSLAVICWVSGFDIIYACLDYEHDLKNKIYSIPANFGLANAAKISRFLHFLMPLFLYLVALELNLRLLFKLGVFFAIAALFYEQKLVKAALKENNMQKIDKAFFEINSWISVVIFVFVLFEVYF